MLQNSIPEGTKTIYLIRHGQTDFNKQGIIQGSGVDTSLNETGEKQASQFFNHYRHIPFQKIYTSNLTRTKQTVQDFTNQGIPSESIPELNEINWGKMEGAMPTEENHLEFVEIVKRWRDGHLDEAVAGGETPTTLFQRQRTGLEKIMSRQDENPILICMHGRAMRSFLCLLTGHPLHLMDDFEHGNVCLYILEKTAEETHFRILLRNSRIHLHDNY